MSADDRLAAKLAELNLELPPAAEPKGVYKPLATAGNLVFLSGHLPIGSDGKPVIGRLGADTDVQAGYSAARLAALGILATLKKQFGDLKRVRRLVKLLGMVNCTPEFTQQPAVINGASELFAAVFGPESGVAARSAFGVNSLPLGASVEIEAIFELQ